MSRHAARRRQPDAWIAGIRAWVVLYCEVALCVAHGVDPTPWVVVARAWNDPPGPAAAHRTAELLRQARKAR